MTEYDYPTTESLLRQLLAPLRQLCELMQLDAQPLETKLQHALRGRP